MPSGAVLLARLCAGIPKVNTILRASRRYTTSPQDKRHMYRPNRSSIRYGYSISCAAGVASSFHSTYSTRLPLTLGRASLRVFGRPKARSSRCPGFRSVSPLLVCPPTLCSRPTGTPPARRFTKWSRRTARGRQGIRPSRAASAAAVLQRRGPSPHGTRLRSPSSRRRSPGR